MSESDKTAYVARQIETDKLVGDVRRSTTNAAPIKALLQGAMTDKIDDHEMFMKGIDYSYYYAQEE